jgi:hypothetical protein
MLLHLLPRDSSHPPLVLPPNDTEELQLLRRVDVAASTRRILHPLLFKAIYLFESLKSNEFVD